jgi:hypothetical protein
VEAWVAALVMVALADVLTCLIVLHIVAGWSRAHPLTGAAAGCHWSMVWRRRLPRARLFHVARLAAVLAGDNGPAESARAEWPGHRRPGV